MKVVSTLLLVLFANSLSAQTIAWLKKAGDMSSNCQAYGVVIDHAHNVIVSGTFQDTANFSGTVLNGRGIFDGYIAKYDSSGTLLWAKNFGGSLHDIIGHAVVDASNNIFVTGYFRSSAIYFTPTDSLMKMVPGTNTSSFIAKFAPDGTFLWAKLIGSTTEVDTWAITLDPAGNIIVGGLFHTDLNISGSNFTNTYYALYIAKFTSAGVFSWAKIGNSTGICKINDIATDAAGNIYSTGKISSPITFSSVATPNNGGDDVFYAKFDSSGNRIFLKVLGIVYPVTTTAGNLDAGNTIRPDNTGNFYVGGSLLVSYAVPVASQMGFFAKYNDTGGQIWINKYGGANLESVTGIGLDAMKNPYVSGLFYATDTIGGMVVPYVTGGNTFIGRFDKNTGNAVWIKTSAGGSSGAEATGYATTGPVAVDQVTSGVMTAGQFKTSISFDSYNVTSTTATTKSDIYMVRIWNYVAGVELPDITRNDVYNIYPNPVKSNVSITLGNAVWHKVFLINSTGQIIHEWETNEAVITADMQDAPPGNYSVIITDNNNNKVVKEITKL